MKRELSRKSFAREMMRHYNFIGNQAIFGAHQDLSETALEKERKLMMKKVMRTPGLWGLTHNAKTAPPVSQLGRSPQNCGTASAPRFQGQHSFPLPWRVVSFPEGQCRLRQAPWPYNRKRVHIPVENGENHPQDALFSVDNF